MALSSETSCNVFAIILYLYYYFPYVHSTVTKWTSALVIVLCIKPAEEATSVADILDKFGHDKEAGKLRGW